MKGFGRVLPSASLSIDLAQELEEGPRRIFDCADRYRVNVTFNHEFFQCTS